MLFAADPGFRSNPSLAEFWNHLTGPRYAVDFTGAAHLAFTDLVFLVPQFAGANKADQARLQPLVGAIDPRSHTRPSAPTYSPSSTTSSKGSREAAQGLALSKGCEPPVADGAGLKRFYINEGNSVMNWIRRAWRFIVDRPLV